MENLVSLRNLNLNVKDFFKENLNKAIFKI